MLFAAAIQQHKLYLPCASDRIAASNVFYPANALSTAIVTERTFPTVVAAFVVGSLLTALAFWSGARIPPWATEQPYQRYIAAVHKAAPSVASVRSRKVSRQANLFEHFFGFPQQRAEGSLGSAVILDNSGYLVTSNHTIQGANEILVELQDGREINAQLVGHDRLTDLAVLKVDAGDNPLPSIELGMSQALEVGERVMAIGNPFGVGQTVTSGIVSALGRETRNPYLQMIQTDAAINPGNSGGALINTRGQLVGISSLLVSSSGTWAGIGYAIPVELVVQVVKDLVTFGSVQRGWLGYMEVRDLKISPDDSGEEAQSAVLIRRLDTDGPLALAGALNGDIIRAINDMPASSDSLRQLLIGARPEQLIKLDIQRGEARFTIRVSTARHPGI